MTLLDRVRQEVAATLNVPLASVTEQTAADNLPAWDSLGHVNLMMSIEQAFDIQLDVDDFPRLTSVSSIVQHLSQQGLG